MQNASECLAWPESWKLGDAMIKTYGTHGESTPSTGLCPTFLNKAGRLQGDRPLLEPVVSWLRKHPDEGFKSAFQVVYKADFCSVAKDMGWLNRLETFKDDSLKTREK